jgi:hypothetical protein
MSDALWLHGWRWWWCGLGMKDSECVGRMMEIEAEAYMMEYK